MERLTTEESRLRTEVVSLERAAALAQHDKNETKRRLEQETELRTKAEGRVKDTEAQLASEVSARQAASSSSQQISERTQQLDKQVNR